MRNTYLGLRNYLTCAAGLCAVFCLLTHGGNAQTTSYWDPTGLTGSAQTSGNWEDLNWSTTASGQATPGSWADGNNILGLNATVGTSGGNYTITANTSHTFGGIINGDDGLNGGTVTINGAPGVTLATPNSATFDTGAGASTIINANVSDTSRLVIDGSGSLSLFGNNNFVNVAIQTSAPIYINNDNSLTVAGVSISQGNYLNLNSVGSSPITSSIFLGGFGSGNFLTFTGGPNAPVTLSAPLAISPGSQPSQLTVNPGSPLTISGEIEGIGALVKQGAGTLILSTVNRFNGTLTLAAGNVQAGNDGAISKLTSLTFAGGGLQVNGHTISSTGTLSVTAGGSVIDFGSGNTGGSLTLAKSSASTISSVLDVDNFNPSVDSIFVGTDANGLTPAQLADIVIDDGTLGTTAILPNGELTLVVPEPSSLAVGALGGLGIFWMLARRNRR